MSLCCCPSDPPQPPAPKAKGKQGPSKKLQLSLEMAQALLSVYNSVKQQQQQQQGDGAGSSAAAAAAGSSVAAAAAPGEEPPLLPKQAFILQLVKECCGPAGALKGEKVVVFSQVSGAAVLACEQCLNVSSACWLAASLGVLAECLGTQNPVPARVLQQLTCTLTPPCTAVALALLLLLLLPVLCHHQGIPVLTALGEVLEQHLGYVRDVHYLRLDGTVTAADRARLIRQFNSDSTKARVGADRLCVGWGRGHAVECWYPLAVLHRFFGSVILSNGTAAAAVAMPACLPACLSGVFDQYSCGKVRLVVTGDVWAGSWGRTFLAECVPCRVLEAA